MEGFHATLNINYNLTLHIQLAWSTHHHLNSHKLFLQGCEGFKDADHTFVQEIQKHLVADISVLNLHLTTRQHVFGAFVLHLLETDCILSVIRRFKVDILRSQAIPCSTHNYLTIVET